jgi:hypothetical protein
MTNNVSSRFYLTTVLPGLQGSLAALGVCAALDPGCAPWVWALMR